MALTLEDLRSRMASATGVDWQAAVTPIVGRLSEAPADTAVFGLAPSPEEIAEAKRTADAIQRFASPHELPKAVDWRARDGADWTSPTRDQGPCGSCVAFATVAALEARIRIDREDAALAVALSQADLFFCGAGRACKTGWSFEKALARCKTAGVGAAEAFAYTPKNQACRRVSPVARVLDYDVFSDLSLRKLALAERGPIIAGMRVFEDFTFYQGGVYKHVAGDARGLHAVCLIGYDDEAQCWIGRNSWGPGWGEDGCFRIGYGECGTDGEFVFYDPQVEYEPGGLA